MVFLLYLVLDDLVVPSFAVRAAVHLKNHRATLWRSQVYCFGLVRYGTARNCKHQIFQFLPCLC